MFSCIRIRKITVYIVVLVLFLTGLTSIVLVKALEGQKTEEKGIFLPIIMYHSILKDPSRLGKYVLSPDVLEKDLKYLSDNGYHTVVVKDLVDYVNGEKPLPEKPVMITFDDGFYNNIIYALPLLEKYNMKAVISVVGSYSETFSKSGDKNPAYSYVTWDDIKQIAKGGYFEIGNHSFDMHKIGERNGAMIYPGESIDHYTNALNSDIMELQNILTEKSGVTPIVFTYPFGAISKESLPILKQMGFKATLTCYEKPNYITKDPQSLYGLNRYNRPSGISTDAFMKKALSE